MKKRKGRLTPIKKIVNDITKKKPFERTYYINPNKIERKKSKKNNELENYTSRLFSCNW